MCRDCLLPKADLAALREKMMIAMEIGDSPEYPWLNRPKTKEHHSQRSCFFSHCIRMSTEKDLSDVLNIWRHDIYGSSPATGAKFNDIDGHEMIIVGSFGELFFAVGKERRWLMGYTATLHFPSVHRTTPLMPRMTAVAMDVLIWKYSAKYKASYKPGKRPARSLYGEVGLKLIDLVSEQLMCVHTPAGILHNLKSTGCIQKVARAWDEVLKKPFVQCLQRDLGSYSPSPMVCGSVSQAECDARSEHASDVSGAGDIPACEPIDSPATGDSAPKRAPHSPDERAQMHQILEQLAEADRAQRAAFQGEIQKMRDGHCTQLAKLAGFHETKLAEIKKELETRKEELETCKRELTQTRNYLTGSHVALDDTQRMWKEDIAKRDANTVAACMQLNEEHAKIVIQRDADAAAERAKLVEEHAEHVKQIQEGMEAERHMHKRALEEVWESEKNTKKRCLAEIDEARKRARAEIDEAVQEVQKRARIETSQTVQAIKQLIVMKQQDAGIC